MLFGNDENNNKNSDYIEIEREKLNHNLIDEGRKCFYLLFIWEECARRLLFRSICFTSIVFLRGKKRARKTCALYKYELFFLISIKEIKPINLYFFFPFTIFFTPSKVCFLLSQ